MFRETGGNLSEMEGMNHVVKKGHEQSLLDSACWVLAMLKGLFTRMVAGPSCSKGDEKQIGGRNADHSCFYFQVWIQKQSNNNELCP